jgi:hypothetical protein
MRPTHSAVGSTPYRPSSRGQGARPGRVGLAETEVAWVVGPVGDIELVGALALALPGLGQVGIHGDKAQLAAGLQRSQIGRLLAQRGRHGLGRQLDRVGIVVQRAPKLALCWWTMACARALISAESMAWPLFLMPERVPSTGVLGWAALLGHGASR